MKTFNLGAYEPYGEAQRGIKRYFRFYNTERRHQALNRHPPDALYFGRQSLPNAA
ncbi:MAG: integrase core domain-containing protein [Gammaproteobacteria bacterium]